MIQLRNTWGANYNCPLWNTQHSEDWKVPLNNELSISALFEALNNREVAVGFNLVFTNNSYVDLDLLNGSNTGEFVFPSDSRDYTGDSYTLQDWIKEFSKMSPLTEDNSYKCEKWKKYVNANQQLSLYNMPKYLILHLKRFEQCDYGGFTRQSSQMRKIDKTVKYPLTNLVM